MKQPESALRNSRAIVFGPFRLSPNDETVYAHGKRVAIRGKAYQVLLLLVSYPNEVIPAERFNRQLWPNTPNDDINLRVQIASLRRVLEQFEGGDQCIQNVSGRGYRFAGKALYEENFVGSTDTGMPLLVHDTLHGIVSPADMSAKDDDVHTIGRLIATGPVTTIVGPGGVGKTVLALQAMRAWCAMHSMDAIFLDLSLVPTPAHVQGALISALLPSLSPHSTPDVAIDLLRGRRLLIVLDSCERVIDAAASLANTLARTTGVKVLATSREPLRVDGESVHRVRPLTFPERDEESWHPQATNFTALRLFYDLARAAGSPVPADESDANRVSKICALLDGLPLAIEHAAACLNVFSLAELTERLIADPLGVLTRGRRTAPIRHKTIRSTIDWSYDELAIQEQRLFRAISIFESPFTLSHAHSIFSDTQVGHERNTQPILLALIDKSLVTVEHRDSRSAFSMSHLVRSHGMEKLVEHGELDVVRERHVEHLIQLLTEPAQYQSADAALDPLAKDSVTLAQIHSAFAWLLTTAPNNDLGVTLAWASYDLYADNDLLVEYRHIVERLAIALDEPTMAAESAFRLHLALGKACLASLPVLNDTARQALHKAFCLARQYESHERMVHVMHYAVQAFLAYGDYDESRRLINILHREVLSRGKGLDLVQRAVTALHLKRGNILSATKHLRKIRESRKTSGAIAAGMASGLRNHFEDHSFKITEAQILWLSGDVTAAYDVVSDVISDALKAGNESLCEALAEGACLIACWNGDARGLRQRHTELNAASQRSSSERWSAMSQCFELFISGVPLDQSPLPWSPPDQHEPALHDMLATLNRKFLTPYAVERARSGKAGYCTPEIYRTWGENLLASGSRSCEESESLFKNALAISRRQGTVFWELRASISLAKLRRRAQASSEAVDLLGSALEKIRVPGESADAEFARILIADFSRNDQEVNPGTWK